MQFEGRRILLINIVALLLFGFVTFSVVFTLPWVKEADSFIAMLMKQARHDAWTPWVLTLTDLNGFRGAAYMTCIVIALLGGYRLWRQALFFFIATWGSAILFGMIKMTIGRMRPEMALLEVGGYSFPSGHTTMATAMAAALYLIMKQLRSDRWWQWGWLFIALLWSLLIGTTRLYLGVHWFSDVVGGVGLGLWWVTLVWYLQSRYYRNTSM